MEPNFFDLLVGGTDDEALAKAQTLAAQLRKDKLMGQMALGGGRLAAPVGKTMLADADQGERGLLAAGTARLHYGQAQQDLKRQLAEEQTRRAMEVQGLKNQGALDAVLARIAGAGGKTGKPLASTEVKHLETLNSDLQTLKDLEARFKDEYAGGLGTNAKTVIAQLAGGSAPDSWEPGAEFWSNYQMFSEIPKRRLQFGTALSANEKALWERAKTLSPRSSPEVIRNTFRQLIQIEEAKLRNHRQSRLAAGYSQDQLDPLTSSAGAAPQGEAAPVPGAVRSKSGRWMRKNAQGKWEYL